ncbi:Eco57I restriction-modification methylase domain-containing protein [Anaeromyxobacter dehalogenans]|uniref:site-specific DNA-methyltransferase (adenine-specific) n=1 Tax=Anaeromyxobacter dehalogenans (strain 2CP-C) TaxID=290397 RepID=Q2IEI9_ANADE|nr:SAM-dependent methyltransferase [Anaeromyxobacter dehalogenans]ABC83001.1 hypothetical protein Adeh_3233 [Anaeromyxobacter dehalogenans 2CP-C]
MASLDRNLRRELEGAVKEARRVAEAGARQAIGQLAVGHHEPWAALSPEQRKLRNRLRAHGRQLGDKLEERKGTQTTERLTRESAYEHWHRLLFARFLAENDLLVEPESGMALSLDECRELAREQGKDWLVLASDFAQRMLPQIFRAGDPVLEVALPPEKRQELEAILERLPRAVFTADDSLGWVYQFWQADQKDAVNASEHKIGADELPAVTQLFTEDYMVLFLLHNTVGAWWAGKVFAAKPELARTAVSEDECRAACAVQGIEWRYLRFVREGDAWRPAPGTFSGWPRAAKGLTVLDPCMGSGHFLAFALPILVALRQAEEKLSIAEAVDAVLRDNLFGLELDPRCTQIAAFNVGLTAWKLAGYRPLPALNLACAGLGINAPVSEWTALAAGDRPAEQAMKQLYELFRQAPTLGSLIDPTRVGGELFVAQFDKIRNLLSSALASEKSEDAELAVVAQGLARAATLLAVKYTLVATNVPYLARGNQSDVLAQHCESHFADAKTDLATCFIERCRSLLAPFGAAALVTPQNWLSQDYYASYRKRLLRDARFELAGQLGPGAFSGISGEVVKPLLIILSGRSHDAAHEFLAIDTTPFASAVDKAAALCADALHKVNQARQLINPKCRISMEEASAEPRLSKFTIYSNGIQTGDSPRYLRSFWELPALDERWAAQQTTVDATTSYGGMSQAILWENGAGSLAKAAENASRQTVLRGKEVWGRRGVLVSAMGSLNVSLYLGTLFDDNTVAVVPASESHLAPIWAFMSDTGYHDAVRRIDKALKVRGPLIEVPFDIGAWSGAVLPVPHALDPTQWIFGGHPRGASNPLQVAVARLVGYRWPRQRQATFLGFPALGPDGLERHVDDDGIVCLPSLRGEAPAAERVRALLADAFGAEWSANKLSELLAAVDFGGKSLDDWLRDGFFEQHCELFERRPFVWQIWDGRKDGFSALVNYHQLAAPNGEGRRILEKLTHTYLGDWLDRQRADQKAGIEGADGRVAAAEHLKRELEKIIEGEPPFDLFVRWKRLQQQPVGWEPDIDDGVRVNIRPFVAARPLTVRARAACILRVTPDIRWGKDKGKEPTRQKADFPWFWGWDESAQDFAGGKEFDGNRWNDLHYTRAAKLAARECAKGGKS